LDQAKLREEFSFNSEVDIIIEFGAKAVAGVEVKAAATLTSKDFRAQKLLVAHLGKQFVAGIVLYDGETVTSFGPRLYAVPIRALWEKVD